MKIFIYNLLLYFFFQGHTACYKTVSAKAVMDTTVLRLPAKAFQKVFQNNPESMVRVVQVSRMQKELVITCLRIRIPQLWPCLRQSIIQKTFIVLTWVYELAIKTTACDFFGISSGDLFASSGSWSYPRLWSRLSDIDQFRRAIHTAKNCGIWSPAVGQIACSGQIDRQVRSQRGARWPCPPCKGCEGVCPPPPCEKSSLTVLIWTLCIKTSCAPSWNFRCPLLKLWCPLLWKNLATGLSIGCSEVGTHSKVILSK